MANSTNSSCNCAACCAIPCLPCEVYFTPGKKTRRTSITPGAGSPTYGLFCLLNQAIAEGKIILPTPPTSTLVDNEDGTFTYTDEDGNPATLDICQLLKDSGCELFFQYDPITDTNVTPISAGDTINVSTMVFDPTTNTWWYHDELRRESVLPGQFVLTSSDSNCIKLDLTGDNVAGWNLEASPIIDPDTTNILECRADGLYVPTPTATTDSGNLTITTAVAGNGGTDVTITHTNSDGTTQPVTFNIPPATAGTDNGAFVVTSNTAANGDITYSLVHTNSDGTSQTQSIQITKADICNMLGNFLTVNAGTTAVVADDANGTSVLGCDDTIHFWSSDASVDINVAQGSSIIDITSEDAEYRLTSTPDAANCKTDWQLTEDGINVSAAIPVPDVNEITDDASTTGNNIGLYTVHNIRGEADTGDLNIEGNAAQEVHIREAVANCERTTTVFVENYSTRTRVNWDFGNDGSGRVNRTDRPFRSVDAALGAMDAAGLFDGQHSLTVDSGVYDVNYIISAGEVITIEANGEVTFTGTRFLAAGVGATIKITGRPNLDGCNLLTNTDALIQADLGYIENGCLVNASTGSVIELNFNKSTDSILAANRGTLYATGKYAENTAASPLQNFSGDAAFLSKLFIDIDEIVYLGTLDNHAAIRAQGSTETHVRASLVRADNGHAIYHNYSAAGSEEWTNKMWLITGRYIGNSATFGTIHFHTSNQGTGYGRVNVHAGSILVQNGAITETITSSTAITTNINTAFYENVSANAPQNANITTLVGTLNVNVNVE